MATPPFTGSIDFKLAIGAFDVRVLRKARITYAYMPAWSYYDVRSDKERSGEFQLEVGLSILALPRSDKSRTSDTPGKRRDMCLPKERQMWKCRSCGRERSQALRFVRTPTNRRK